MSRAAFLTIIGIMLALFLGALDQTIVATALPKIVEDLQGLDRFSWVATSYLVASTAFVPIYGKLADLYDHKKIEISAIAIFLFGSVLCGMAGEFGSLPLLGDGMSQLILFRAIQGVGGAGLFAMAFIIIAEMFPPAERGKYQGWIGAVFAISSVLGPWLGGLLTDHATDLIPGISGWRWVFYVNMPFGGLALWFIINKMPSLQENRNKEKAVLDYLAAALLISGLVPLIIALQLDKNSYPWLSPITSGLIIISLVCLLIFYFRSKHSENPILNLDLFKDRVFKTANPPTFLLGAAFLGILIFSPLYFINVLELNATQAGLGMIPLSIGILTASISSGQLVSKIGNYKIILLIGVFIFFVGVYLLSTINQQTGYYQILIYMFISGIGLGPAMPLYPLAIQNSAPPEVLGQATSANQFFRQIGGAVGASVLGALLTSSLNMSFTKIQEKEKLDFISTNDLAQEGIIALNRGFDENNRQTLQHLEEWYHSKSPESKTFLLNKTDLPETIRTTINKEAVNGRIKEEGGNGWEPKEERESRLQEAKALYLKTSSQQQQIIQQSIKNSFAVAISGLYQFSLYIIALAWLFTWFIPQIPLRNK